eukprot:CAMPEP_0172091374 /NCGR_PEP_ID=MMETSP1043-20130122/24869_1 /TAXON_ID=464988 /ORGANISM="Hemiselmis andersenii, Strain CCMP441" /LENGTH=116 /DNA_ID=CAMNT_0012754013 /DNA_START=1 /DNA_END=352 /DNA_ORIENTATION=-
MRKPHGCCDVARVVGSGDVVLCEAVTNNCLSVQLTKIPGKVYENDRMSMDIHCHNNTFRPSDEWWGNNDPNNRLQQAGVFLNSATPLLDGEFGQADSMFSMADGCTNPVPNVVEVH